MVWRMGILTRFTERFFILFWRAAREDHKAAKVAVQSLASFSVNDPSILAALFLGVFAMAVVACRIRCQNLTLGCLHAANLVAIGTLQGEFWRRCVI